MENKRGLEKQLNMKLTSDHYLFDGKPLELTLTRNSTGWTVFSGNLKITHDNAGHPTSQDFARLLRRGHARPEVANWVRKHFSCADCEANKRPSARRPAAVPRTYRFNHVVGIDLVKAPNPLTKQKEW